MQQYVMDRPAKTVRIVLRRDISPVGDLPAGDPEELFLAYGWTEEMKKFRPLRDYTGLFKEFAELKPQTSAVLRFVSDYGFLGCTSLANIEAPGRKPSPSQVESLAAWSAHRWLLGTTLELWQHALDENEEGVSKLMSVNNGIVSLVEHHLAANPTIPHIDLLPRSMSSPFGSGSKDAPGKEAMIGAAKWLVNGTVNRALDRFVRLRLDVQQEPTHDTESESISLEPASLLGVVWLQFALYIAEHKNYQRCSHCNRWYEVQTKLARRDKTYCGVNCRSRAYRARKQQQEDE